MIRLSEERIASLPWGTWERARPEPPPRDAHGPRVCHLCGLPYLGGGRSECMGGPRCPRYHGYRRRHVLWYGGFWVPAALARRWEFSDAVTESAGGVIALAQPALPAVTRVDFKPPPTTAQMAAYDARRMPGVAKPPPAGVRYEAAPPKSHVAGPRPPPQHPGLIAARPSSSSLSTPIMPPPRPLAQPSAQGRGGAQSRTTSTPDRSRSPGGLVAGRTSTFTGLRAGVFIEPSSEASSEEEVVHYGRGMWPGGAPASPAPSQHGAEELRVGAPISEEERLAAEARSSAPSSIAMGCDRSEPAASPQ